LLIVGTHYELYIAAAIGGIVWAGSIAMSSAILADVYGVKLVGILYGWAYVSHQVGAMISSWLGGWGYEAFGTHWVAFGMAGVLLLMAAVISLRLPRSKRPDAALYWTFHLAAAAGHNKRNCSISGGIPEAHEVSKSRLSGNFTFFPDSSRI